MVVRGLATAGILFIILIFADMLGGLVTALWYLLAGWFAFLRRVVPQTQVNTAGVMTAAACLIGAIGLTQYLGRMFSPNWRAKWTVATVAIVVLMFAAGTAVVGMTHQVVWLRNSETPLFVYGGRSRESANRIKCASNLRQLTVEARLYANDHGSYPDTIGQLLLAAPDVTPEQLTCPSGSVEKLVDLTREEVARRTDEGHTAYVYFGRGLPANVPDDTPIFAESMYHHGGDGMNIGFASGQVYWQTPQEAREVLQRVGRTATTRPAR